MTEWVARFIAPDSRLDGAPLLRWALDISEGMSGEMRLTVPRSLHLCLAVDRVSTLTALFYQIFR
ncbi:hypothetical protein ACC691_37005, partial [Rhizobium johnstonii]|uniref:hypothetical protein n=1 Tax=Rhizobium johnstonii TaxID=3019933 RepID=UPI003F992304